MSSSGRAGPLGDASKRQSHVRPQYSPPVDNDDLGAYLLGERGCVQLLAVLELPEAERAALMAVGGVQRDPFEFMGG